MLANLLQRWRVRRLSLTCPTCAREASPANVARGRSLLLGSLTCEYCRQAADVAGWRLAALRRGEAMTRLDSND